MQAVAHGDDQIPPKGDTGLEAAFRQLKQPRARGEQLNEVDHEAATLVLDAYWPKFGVARRLPERWR